MSVTGPRRDLGSARVPSLAGGASSSGVVSPRELARRAWALLVLSLAFYLWNACHHRT